MKETGQKGWIPKLASKPTSAKRAGIPPAPPGATGSKPFEEKKDWKDNKSELLYSLSPSSYGVCRGWIVRLYSDYSSD